MKSEKSKWIKMAQEYLFPNRCPVCFDIVVPRGNYICDVCRDKFPIITGAVCKKCGKPLDEEEKEFCRDCICHIRLFQGIAMMPYQDAVVHRMMLRVKYQNARQLLDYPCQLMGIRYKNMVKNWNIEALIPVPIHESRRRMRGFNQAEEIALALGEFWNLPVDTSLFIERKRRYHKKT